MFRGKYYKVKKIAWFTNLIFILTYSTYNAASNSQEKLGMYIYAISVIGIPFTPAPQAYFYCLIRRSALS